MFSTTLDDNKYAESSKINKGKFSLIIHGGAGAGNRSKINKDTEETYLKALREILKAGAERLSKGESSLETVASVVTALEDCPLFNAGKGSVFTKEGKHEMDAAIMDGKDLRAGAVCCVGIIKNPIKAAKLVMEETPHVLLTGEGAEKFAKEKGCEIVDPSYFWTQIRWDQYLKLNKKNSSEGQTTQGHGTVGAVALDVYGNLASATSTGGSHNKMTGRIGDTALIGSGTYANNLSCAVSCTGIGEFFIRNCVAFDVSAQMNYGKISLKEAVKDSLLNKVKSLGGEGGLIAVDREGNIAIEFNTERMTRGYVDSSGKIYAAMF
jgi:L-asparaginase / beta-aspartyl-peptidase